MKNVNGFGGWLVVTQDKDWEEKWNTPQENTPSFSEAKEVSYGEELTILIFFTNPRPNDEGFMNIACDLMVVRPDETYSIDEKDVACANWKVPPKPYNHNIQLTQAVIKYIGETGDLPGKWKVYVNLKDKNAGIEVPLETEFKLLGKSANKSNSLDDASAVGD